MDLDSKPDNFLSEEKTDPVIKFDGGAPADSGSPQMPEKPKTSYYAPHFMVGFCHNCRSCCCRDMDALYQPLRD